MRNLVPGRQVLRSVALQLPNILGTHPNLIKHTELNAVELGYGLRLWGADTLRDERSIFPQLHDLHAWHHQVFCAGKPKLYARSMKLDGRWQIVQVARSNRAQAIDRAKAWVEQQSVHPPMLRLLRLAHYRVYALWILDDNAFVFVEVPLWMRDTRKRRIYAPQEFLHRICRHPHVPSVIEKRE